MNFDRLADIESIVSALRRDGVMVVTNLVEPELVEAVRIGLRPEFDSCGLKTKRDFNGSQIWCQCIYIQKT